MGPHLLQEPLTFTSVAMTSMVSSFTSVSVIPPNKKDLAGSLPSPLPPKFLKTVKPLSQLHTPTHTHLTVMDTRILTTPVKTSKQQQPAADPINDPTKTKTTNSDPSTITTATTTLNTTMMANTTATTMTTTTENNQLAQFHSA